MEAGNRALRRRRPSLRGPDRVEEWRRVAVSILAFGAAGMVALRVLMIGVKVALKIPVVAGAATTVAAVAEWAGYPAFEEAIDAALYALIDWAQARVSGGEGD